MRNRFKKVRGIGTNDANYQTQVYGVKNGKRVCLWVCPYYKTWSALLKRVTTYKTEPKVCDEWLNFSNFKAWMETQDWKGKELDKDVLSSTYPIYSPETCCFLPHNLNCLLKDNASYSDTYPLGVCSPKTLTGSKAFLMQVEKFVVDGSRKQKIAKKFNTVQEAHSAWQMEKAKQIEAAVAWYAEQSCFRTDVAEALTKRVWNLRLQSSRGEFTTKIS